MLRVQRVVFALTTSVAAVVAALPAAHPAGAASAGAAPVRAAECASEYPQWIGTYVGTLHEQKFTVIMQPGEQATYQLGSLRKGPVSAHPEKTRDNTWRILFGGSDLIFGVGPSCTGSQVSKFLVMTEFRWRADAWVTRQETR